MGQYFDWSSAIWIMGELPYEKGRSMSHYPQAKLDELTEILAEEHADLKPEPGTAGKNFRAAYDCRPIFFYDRVLWVSEEFLKREVKIKRVTYKSRSVRQVGLPGVATATVSCALEVCS